VVPLVLGGCAGLRERPTACRLVPILVGGTLGAVGGGVGVGQIENDPSSGEIAAGAAAGLVGGGLIGAIVSYYICKEEPKPAPPPPPPPPPAPRKVETLKGAHFDFNKSTLTAEGKSRIDGVARTLRDNPTWRVRVEGHTDSVGSDAYNMRLSEARARTVRERLVDQGVSPSRIVETRGYGESRPVASNATAAGRAENRRVEILGE
jgi:OOP family OmpA-OmpF porin